MSAPKTTVKISKDGSVTYESNVDAANYYLFELTRAALRDVGKYVRKQWQIAYDQHFKKRTGKGRTATTYKVWSSKSTQYPRVQIGMKQGAEGFYAYFQEFGTSKPNKFGYIVPKLGLLTHAAQDNAGEIQRIEAQYLSALDKEPEQIESMIDEEEMDGDDDGELY